MGIVTVLWEKWREFKRDFVKITIAALITPVMYLIIFGIGVQVSTTDMPYMRFLIPGIIAMATMTGSFGSIAQNMSVQRLYEKALDQVMISPTPLWQFITGQIVGGSLRGIYAGVVIMVITIPIRAQVIYNGWTFLIMLLNGMVFSTIALTISFWAKSYTDVPKYNAYIIVPMSFLCNTFFSTDRMPDGFRQIISLLPLSQASKMIRDIASGGAPTVWGISILLFYLLVFSGISFFFIYQKKNL